MNSKPEEGSDIRSENSIILKGAAMKKLGSLIFLSSIKVINCVFNNNHPFI